MPKLSYLLIAKPATQKQASKSQSLNRFQHSLPQEGEPAVPAMLPVEGVPDGDEAQSGAFGVYDSSFEGIGFRVQGA